MICIYDTIWVHPLRWVYRRAVICRVSWDVFSWRWKCIDVRQNVQNLFSDWAGCPGNKNHICTVFIHNHKNSNGLNLFAITVHINCTTVLITGVKHCLQSGTCLLWEMVGCDMALLVEISYLSHSMSCSSHSFTLLQLAFLFWFISLEKKKE